MSARMILLLLCSLAAGCASTPGVELTHYAPKADVRFSGSVTIACSPQDVPFVVATVADPAVQYSADRSRPLRPLSLGSLDSPFANTEIELSLSADGRLLGINVEQAGQGEEIVDAVIDLASAAASRDVEAYPDLCNSVRLRDKSGAWTFDVMAHPTNLGTPSRAPFTAASPLNQQIYEQIQEIDGVLCVVGVPVIQSGDAPVRYSGSSGDAVLLQLVRTRPMSFEVRAMSRQECAGSGAPSGPVHWSGQVVVPQVGAGAEYDVPIPRAAMFGDQTFKLQLTEAGAIKSLTYGEKSGTAAALSSLSDVRDHIERTNAERAAALKSEDDLRAAQRHHAMCLADLTEC